MNLLLDTHVLLWAFEDDRRLGRGAREAIVDGGNIVFVSAVSAWEITIKKALGKLRAPDGFLEELARHRFTPLEVTIEHALAVGRLPPLHQDPFDRLLLAQAVEEQLTLVTHDRRLEAYGGSILLV
ncbi:MAG: type II toxin-antitoxin system VapC family toxin [Polyangia bacterium]|jgi:PIN domain nuclease of toxin-antitoxin system|nr:type II toxin-antitoxin system VapC family toxin [Polyangia bacterium]